MSNIPYRNSNEILKAIMVGLDITNNDIVLAVCGSGDQPFAILELAKSVVAVDINTTQIEYAKERQEKLVQGNFEEFLKLPEPNYIGQERNRYFREGKRLEHIRKKLDNLMILKVNDISEAIGKAKFNKIYFSNIGLTGSKEKSENMVNVSAYLDNLASQLSLPGLMYTIGIFGNKGSVARNDSWNYQCNKDSWPKLLVLDERLSKGAQKYEINYKPTIFRKVV